jgi:hypothetical protein
MTRLLVLAVLVLGYAACQKPGDEEDVCDQARVHREECMLSGGATEDVECTEREECVAGCTLEASCDELEDPDPDGDYIECLVDCQKQSGPGRTEPCDEAIAQLDSCGVDTSGIVTGSCSGADACVAECVNAADCVEILGEVPESPYAACLSEC